MERRGLRRVGGGRLRRGPSVSRPPVRAAGHVAVYVVSILAGGIAAALTGELPGLFSRGGGLGSVEEVRRAAAVGMVVGGFLSLPFVLLLVNSTNRGFRPGTWWGWSVAGFAFGFVPSALFTWLPRLGTP